MALEEPELAPTKARQKAAESFLEGNDLVQAGFSGFRFSAGGFLGPVSNEGRSPNGPSLKNPLKGNRVPWKTNKRHTQVSLALEDPF